LLGENRIMRDRCKRGPSTRAAFNYPQVFCLSSSCCFWCVLKADTYGFVVPRSFEEFFGRHPRYVRGRVRLCWPNGTDSEREDHESELLIFLMSLPDKSKFRARGYNGFPDGCRDRIQTFNPDLAYGASEPRFFNYFKIILTNRLISLWQKAASNPVRASNTSSFYSPEPDGTLLDEDYIMRSPANAGRSG
jgi:hypothetical protein